MRTAQNLKVATLTEKALEAGEITFEKAEVIARTMAGLPESLDELTRVRVEKRLIGDAKRLSLPDLRRRVMRVADIYRPRDEADARRETPSSAAKRHGRGRTPSCGSAKPETDWSRSEARFPKPKQTC